MNAQDSALSRPSSHGVGSRFTWTLVVLAALGFLTVTGSLTAPLLRMDDNIQISENPFLQHDHNWWEAFSQYHYCQYIPVTHVSYRVNATLFGLETAWAYRLVNWLLHVVSAAVLLSTLRALGVARLASLFAACVWVVHPMACESVGWVTERSNVLAFFFGNLAFHFYVLRGDSWRHIALSAFLFGLALLSKSLALGWMPVFLVYEVLGGSPGLSGTEQPSRRAGVWPAMLRLSPFLLLTAALTTVGLSGYQSSVRPPPGGSLFTALLTDLDIYARYVFNIVLPFRLSAFYGVDAIVSLRDPRLWGFSGLWVLLVGGTVWLSVTRRRTIFGWLWFFGGLGPASNIVAIVYPMQDRFAYLSTAGLLLVLVDAANGVAARIPAVGAVVERRRVWVAVLAAYVALLGTVAFQRSYLWGDLDALSVDAVEKQPESSVAHVFMGRQYDYLAWCARMAVPPDERRSRMLSGQAVEEYTLALSLQDSYLFNPRLTRLTLGGSLLESGESNKAVALLTEVLPQPDPGRLLAKDQQQKYYVVIDGPFAFPYALSFEDVAKGHQWLAEAYLEDFTARVMTPAEAAECLDRVARHCDWARAHAPNALITYFTLAHLFILKESFSASPPAEAQRVAQTVLGIAQSYIDSMAGEPLVLAELRVPVPENRPKAMACLGMAQASFEAFRRPGLVAEKVRAYREKTFLWARRAIGFDPEFSESYWFLAEVCQQMANAAREHSGVDAAVRLEQQAMEWLSKIKPGSPRFEVAQRVLSQRVAPGR